LKAQLERELLGKRMKRLVLLVVVHFSSELWYVYIKYKSNC
jgi:hypothetical protein